MGKYGSAKSRILAYFTQWTFAIIHHADLEKVMLKHELALPFIIE